MYEGGGLVSSSFPPMGGPANKHALPIVSQSHLSIMTFHPFFVKISFEGQHKTVYMIGWEQNVMYRDEVMRIGERGKRKSKVSKKAPVDQCVQPSEHQHQNVEIKKIKKTIVNKGQCDDSQSKEKVEESSLTKGEREKEFTLNYTVVVI